MFSGVPEDLLMTGVELQPEVNSASGLGHSSVGHLSPGFWAPGRKAPMGRLVPFLWGGYFSEHQPASLSVAPSESTMSFLALVWQQSQGRLRVL